MKGRHVISHSLSASLREGERAEVRWWGGGKKNRQALEAHCRF
jgi:hypothetical protein